MDEDEDVSSQGELSALRADVRRLLGRMECLARKLEELDASWAEAPGLVRHVQ